MSFSFNQSIEILANTPNVISAILGNLSDHWVNTNEGGNTWTAKEVVAHLILCEETNWLTRAKIILSYTPNQVFAPIDMTAHFHIAEKYTLNDLLNKFQQLRKTGLEELNRCNLREQDLQRKGIHPVTGEVTLQQIIATWVVHDMTHISQIARVIAKQNKEAVGSFQQFLKILN